MKLTRSRRVNYESGFTIVEALVSLTVAASTLLLLSGATIGLRAITVKGTLNEPSLTDLAITRRIVGEWIDQISARKNNTSIAIRGSKHNLRMIVRESGGLHARINVALSIEEIAPYNVLFAERDFSTPSLTAALKKPQRTELLRSKRDLHFDLVTAGDSAQRSIGRQDAMVSPRAVRLLIDGRPMFVWNIRGGVAADCLVMIDERSLKDRLCTLQ